MAIPHSPLGDMPGQPLDAPLSGPFPEFSVSDPALDDPDYYPTSDGRPMGETDLHRQEMVEGIETLKMHYDGEEVYISGNILLYYKPGNRRRHVEAARREAEAGESQERAARQKAEAAETQERAARLKAEAAENEERAAREKAEAAGDQERAARQKAEQELARLKKELESLRQSRAPGSRGNQ